VKTPIAPADTDILIVDDNPTNLDLLSEVLEGHGYRYRVATSGRATFGAIAAARPDLVLLDISMPEMNGYEVCERLKADPETARIPILFLSALDEPFDKVRAFDVGAADYIGKPFQIPEVMARIEHQLARSRLELDLERRNQELADKNAALLRLSEALEQANRELARLTVTDPLTGLANRRRIHEAIDEEWRRALRNREPVSALMIDIDCFKLFNDTYGHLEGDACLRSVSEAIRGSTRRAGDVVGRWGGEEFLVILSGMGRDDAGRQGERIRSAVESLAIPHQASSAASVVTVSVGAATVVPGEQREPNQLLAKADQALYRAKAQGRNRSVSAEERQVE